MAFGPEPASAPRVLPEGVSRSGAIPEPTVTVRMEENESEACRAGADAAFTVRPDSRF